MNGSWDTLPVKEAKKPRRQEQLTVFFSPAAAGTPCGGGRIRGLPRGPLGAAEHRRDAFCPAGAFALSSGAPAASEQLQKVIERTHVFTHVESGNMRCYVRVWRSRAGLYLGGRRGISGSIALPTAFRMFWEPEDGQAEK